MFGDRRCFWEASLFYLAQEGAHTLSGSGLWVTLTPGPVLNLGWSCIFLMVFGEWHGPSSLRSRCGAGVCKPARVGLVCLGLNETFILRDFFLWASFLKENSIQSTVPK